MRTETGAVRMAVLILTAVATGCDSVSGESAQPAVLVTVNATPITAAGIEQTLPASAVRPDRQQARQAIEVLIDEELLVQEAIASGLEEDPAVAASQAQASRQTLARLAAERIVADVAPVDPVRVREFYDSHPAWYAERKLFQFVVFVVDRRLMTAEVQTELDSAHSPARVRAVLERRGLSFRTQALTAAAEDLPEGKLPDFSASSPGDLLLAAHGPELYLLSVSSVTAAPLAFAAARGAIESRLNEEARREALGRYLRGQRSRAAIAYHETALDPYLAAFDAETPAGEGREAHGLSALTP